MASGVASVTRSSPPNPEIASRLEEVAALLEAQRANPFQVRAYRNAATVIRNLPVSVAELYADEGSEGLERIPQIGAGLARAIRDLLIRGRLPMLDRLRGESDPAELFATIPGIGAGLADRLHLDLGLETLEDLEVAVHDGRLATLPGFGPKRLAGVAAALAERLGRVRVPAGGGVAPPIGELLDVDRIYREGAAAGQLPTIAPRRFNPQGRAWLPVLHLTRGPRHYTALFSNTALAHRLGRTHDWVVLYADGDREERVATVVTARGGPLGGRRVVRGREADCLQYYGAGIRAGSKEQDDDRD